MKLFVFLAAVGLASAASVNYDAAAPAAYGEAAPSGGYGGDGYEQKQKCSYYDETQYKEHCEDFEEKVCTTTHKESCNNVSDQACRGVVSAKQMRKCFDVTEQKCSLKEDWKMVTIDTPVTVQTCRKVPEQVCDTIYEPTSGKAEKQQCITVDATKCSTTQKTVYDRTCRQTYNIDCKITPAYAPAKEAYGQKDAYGAGGYGEQQAASGGYSSQNSYGMPEPNCHKTPEEKCYQTPRQVSVQSCYSAPEKVCERLIETVPSVKTRQTCHMEEKRVCDLVKRTQPKQVKQYFYTKQCRDVPRQVCENSDMKTLLPSCVPTTRQQCSHSPVEKCESIPRKKCFNLAYKVRKQKCEPVEYKQDAYAAPDAYAAQDSYAAPEQASGYAEEASGY